MKYYTEPSREIPVAAETEVLVVGGGPAGFGAALHAARMGRKTMLIEQYGAVGGVATTGIMSHWTGRQDGGCFEELRAKARDCEAEQVINPEKLRILMLDMLMEAGVNVQLYTGFSDVIMVKPRCGCNHREQIRPGSDPEQNGDRFDRRRRRGRTCGRSV